MKHIITFFKRSVVVCLVSVILTLTVVSDYQEASKVYASSFVESGYYALRAITQAVLSSMGYSYSSTSDLDISTQGLENIISSYKDSDSFGDAATLTALFDITAGKDIGDKIALTNPVVAFVKNYLTNQMAGKSTYSADADVSNTSVLCKTSLSESKISSCLLGLPAYCYYNGIVVDSSINPLSGFHSAFYLYGFFACTSKSVYSNLGTKSFNIYYPRGILFNSSVSSTAILVSDGSNLSCINKTDGSSVGFYSGQLYTKVADQSYWFSSTTCNDYGDGRDGSCSYIYANTKVSTISISSLEKCYYDCPIYKSYEDWANITSVVSLYSIKSRIVGDTSVSKQMTDTLTVTDDSSTKKVEDAITTATADGSTLTDADLDAIASKIIDAQNTNTGEITDSVDGSTSILEKIQDVLVTSIVAPIVSIETFVKTISNSLTTWFPKTVSAINDWAETFPTDVLEYARVGIESFPKVIDAINDISIPFPDVMSISIPDVITKALSDILVAIQGIFVVDTVAVATASENLTDIWNQHLPFIPKLKNLFNNISFSDSYDYPVLKMGTPQVIRPYYDNDYIILLDFKDYAYYLLWGRRIVRAMLWVGFAYSIIKQFKVHFHIG